jgi:hypothetical protein
MTESEMEDLLWEHTEKLLDEKLTKFKRQQTSAVGRSDLIFKDSIGRFLVVEIKRGTLKRGAIPQLLDYYGMMKSRFPDEVVELMVIANEIPKERRLACEQFNIEPREISVKRFRDVANEVNYIFRSEISSQKEPVEEVSSQLQCPISEFQQQMDVPTNQKNTMEGEVIIEYSRTGNKIIKTKIGLFPDTYWRDDLKAYPTELLCRIRQSLLKSIPQLAEKFNASGHYFGYRKGQDKDRVYLYMQKKCLHIDLDISRDNEKAIKEAGFVVNSVKNHQYRVSWLTGWQVPHNTENIETVMKWLCMAFRQ